MLRHGRVFYGLLRDTCHSRRSQILSAKKPDLVSHWEFCYERALGCVGLLKHWLLRVLEGALDQKCRSITVGQLERAALTASQCEQIASEMIEYEAQLEESQEARTHLQLLLGLREVVEPQKAGRERKNIQGRVGQRTPRRDQVGIKRHAS